MKKIALSAEGIKFLNDPVMYAALSAIADSVNSTPEEYLLRFEAALTDDNDDLRDILEKAYATKR